MTRKIPPRSDTPTTNKPQEPEMTVEPNNPKPTKSKFDLSSLRLSQDYSEMSGVQKVITTVPARRPGKQDFIRVRAGAEFQLETMVLETQEDREVYLVRPDIYQHLPDGVAVAKVLRLAITRQNIVFLWPIKLADVDGRLDSWNDSAHRAAKMAEEKWIRMAAKRSLGAYETFIATGDFSEPEWPDLSFQQILEIAFSTRLIESTDHIVLRKLRGEV